MSGSFDKVLGIHAAALTMRAQRSEILASNLANVDTPNYKARDIDFRSALSKARDQQTVEMRVTRSGHIGSSGNTGRVEKQYRIPTQPSLDGNTVDTQVEQAKFAENAIRYEASLRFVNDRIQGLMAAIKGE